MNLSFACGRKWLPELIPEKARWKYSVHQKHCFMRCRSFSFNFLRVDIASNFTKLKIVFVILISMNYTSSCDLSVGIKNDAGVRRVLIIKVPIRAITFQNNWVTNFANVKSQHSKQYFRYYSYFLLHIYNFVLLSRVFRPCLKRSTHGIIHQLLEYQLMSNFLLLHTNLSEKSNKWGKESVYLLLPV